MRRALERTWVYGIVLLSVGGVCQRLSGEDPPAPPKPTAPKSPASELRSDDTWAEKYLAEEDPLAARETLTLADLQAALADPKLRPTVVRHVARAGLDEAQAERFLTEALASPASEVRRDAAVELQRRKRLVAVVTRILWELSKSDDAGLRQAAVVALEFVDIPYEKVPEHYWRTTIAALASDDPDVRRSAAAQLERWQAASVPALLDALRSDDANARRAAAAILARILAPPTAPPPEKPAAPGPPSIAAPAPAPAPGRGPEPTKPKFAERPLSKDSPVRTLEKRPANPVQVFFGTNRVYLGARRASPTWRLAFWSSIFLGGLAVVGWRIFYAPIARRHPAADAPERDTSDRQHRFLSAFVLLGGLGITAWSIVSGNEALREVLAPGSASPFGAERDPAGVLRYGYCTVTIPPSHIEGNLEEATLGPERESEHVMLKKTELLEENAFYEQVRTALRGKPADQRDCFVFVHGYNVTFEKAARRTAQIHFDLEFQGLPIFFSWPSRGNFADYALDRAEVESRTWRDIQKFLVDVARRANARRVHVLAHSMGADAVTRAIRELGPEGQIFDQIVLAAPDIDRRVFLEEIAPRLGQHAQRTTLYCSRNDLALFFSRYWNSPGDPRPRAGDSTVGPIILRGMDTVDASAIRTDLLGHSYYGDCVPLLKDVGLLLKEGLAPDQRRLEVQVAADADPDQPRLYWMFRD